MSFSSLHSHPSAPPGLLGTPHPAAASGPLPCAPPETLFSRVNHVSGYLTSSTERAWLRYHIPREALLTHPSIPEQRQTPSVCLVDISGMKEGAVWTALLLDVGSLHLCPWLLCISTEAAGCGGTSEARLPNPPGYSLLQDFPSLPRLKPDRHLQVLALWLLASRQMSEQPPGFPYWSFSQA